MNFARTDSLLSCNLQTADRIKGLNTALSSIRGRRNHKPYPET